MPEAKLSIVTPAFNESRNLPVFYERLKDSGLPLDWEWIIVDDHSKDNTFAVAHSMAETDERVKVFRLARNSGSHAALLCGLEKSTGDICAVMAADLQDPPEFLPTMIARWLSGAQVVWAVRAQRLGESAFKLLTSKLYYQIMQRMLGKECVPANGADFFLIDRIVVQAMFAYPERKNNIFALLAWMGFRQDFVEYVKQARLHGESGWTLKQCFRMVKDSITSFTAIPLRMTCYAGCAIAGIGGLWSIEVLVNAILGHPVLGWSSLMIAMLLIGGFQLVMLGVIGEYIWAALDEIRSRPRYQIENSAEEMARASQVRASLLGKQMEKLLTTNDLGK